MIIKSISRVELIKINVVEHDEFDLNTSIYTTKPYINIFLKELYNMELNET
jgi:hypothetical protein